MQFGHALSWLEHTWYNYTRGTNYICIRFSRFVLQYHFSLLYSSFLSHTNVIVKWHRIGETTKNDTKRQFNICVKPHRQNSLYYHYTCPQLHYWDWKGKSRIFGKILITWTHCLPHLIFYVLLAIRSQQEVNKKVENDKKTHTICLFPVRKSVNIWAIPDIL